MDHDGGAVAPGATRLARSCGRSRCRALDALVDRVAPADGNQGIGHPLVEGRAVSSLASGRSGDEGALHDDVLIFGERPRQCPAAVVEAEEAAGIGPRRPLVGLVPGRQRQLADLFGRPVRRLFGQPHVGLGLGHLDERLHLVERELPLRQGISDPGEGREFGGGGDPFTRGGGRDPAPVDEPGDHGRGAIDSPRPSPVQLGHRRQQLALMSRDRTVMLGHAGDEGLGPPRHRAGAGSVSEKGGCHADGERSRSDVGCGDRARPPHAEWALRWLSDTGRRGPTLRDCARAAVPGGGSPPPAGADRGRRRRGRRCHWRRGWRRRRR